MNNRFIVIMGPTGVGKSDLVLKLSEQFDIEIINGDIGSFYKPCTIGTAKPDWQHCSTPHHLFDVITDPRDCTVTEYRESVLDCLNKVWLRNKIPVLVGGSGFYLKSLFFPPQIINHFSSKSTHEKTENLVDEILPSMTEGSWQDLYLLDPKRANNLNKNDHYRINRALSLIKATGKKASDFKPVYNQPAGDVLIIFLDRNRQELYNRIDDRVYLMMNQGWIDEVISLMNNGWKDFLKRKKLIGYDDLIEYLESNKKNDTSLIKKTVEIIQKKSRHYAKRQLTFWRSFNKNLQEFKDNKKLLIHEINLSEKDGSDNFIEIVNNFLTD